MVFYHGKKIHPKSPLPPEPPCLLLYYLHSHPEFVCSVQTKTGEHDNKKYERYESAEMFNIKLNIQQGFHPRHFSFPQNAITPPTGNTSLSQSAGVVGGDRHCPLCLLASASYFMSN